MRGRTPGMRRVSSDLKTSWSSVHRTNGNSCSTHAMMIIKAARLKIFFITSPEPRASYFDMENASALPTAKRKKGNTRSVGVQPFQGECSSGGYTYCQL